MIILEYEQYLTRNGIWNIKQNKPTLVANDFEKLGIPKSITYSILLARGVFKWLSARRDLIKLKDLWRDELTCLYRNIENKEIKRGTPEYYQAIGRIKAFEECRSQIRTICHSERWIAPDFDSQAQKFLLSLDNDPE